MVWPALCAVFIILILLTPSLYSIQLCALMTLLTMMCWQRSRFFSK